ncbi:MAG: VOC family protein [Chloroflexota bacterium]|jgi:predicted 3-demethylubiquinone-9 3-methyltransferase (glyoxalase superfamily)|nr:VOC family protein [Lentimicrobium sp.]
MKNEIYPCLWFDGLAYEAAEFYCSVFPDSEILETNPVVTLFILNGNKFMALNGGDMFKFNESVSFVVECEDQERIDYYWEKLTQEGEESMCGWLKDKYGVSWQIVPDGLAEMLKDGDKAQRIFQVISPMRKLDYSAIKNA